MSIRTPLFVLVALLASTSLVGAVSGPSISFDKKVCDYGKVIYGKTVSEQFIVTNNGDAPLKIEKLKASCGCTKAVEGSSEVPPNGHTNIMITFDTTGMRAGRKRRYVDVYSNDPKHSMVKLLLYADVVRLVTAGRENVMATVSDSAKYATFPLKVTNSSAIPVTVYGVKTPSEAGPAKLNPARIVIAPHSTAACSVTVKLLRDPGRAFWNGRFDLETNHPKEKQIELHYLVQEK
jgi:Protein of unknown function (DUF1573)